MRLVPRREKDTRRVVDVNSHIIPKIENGKPNPHEAATRAMAEHHVKMESWKKSSNSPEALRPTVTSDVASASKTMSKGY
jgi:hypothetical protein